MVRNQSNFLGETNMCDRPSSKRESAAAILAKATVSWNAAGLYRDMLQQPFQLGLPHDFILGCPFSSAELYMSRPQGFMQHSGQFTVVLYHHSAYEHGIASISGEYVTQIA